METRGLNTISQYPFLPSSATPPFLAFFLLASFPFSPSSLFLPSPPPCGQPIPVLPSLLPQPPFFASQCALLPRPTAPSLHSTGDSGKGAEGSQQAQTIRQPSQLQRRCSEESLLPALLRSDQLVTHTPLAIMSGRWEEEVNISFPSIPRFF